MTTPHRILLIRPWRDASCGGGCCSVDAATLGGVVEPGDHDHRTDVYRLLVAELPPEVDVQIVAANNLVYLLPTVIRDARSRGRSWAQAARAVLHATTPGAVVVDGQAITSPGGAPDSPERMLALVRAALPERFASSSPGRTP